MERITLVLFLLLTVCCSFAVSNESKRASKEERIFALDTNNDGILDMDELMPYVKAQRGPYPNEEHLKTYLQILLNYIDENDDGKATTEELHRHYDVLMKI